jgi:hypothetical protein
MATAPEASSPRTTHASAIDAPAGSSAPADDVEFCAAPPSPPHGRTCLRSGIRKPKIYKDGTVCYGLLDTTGEPTSVTDALADTKWRKEMKEEYGALLQNKTWHLVSPSSNENVVD